MKSEDDLADFRVALDLISEGYGEGSFDDRRYGVTLDASADRRRRWLYAEELGGTDRISFNLYALSEGRLVLRPCEMPDAKVIDFVLRFVPEDRRAADPTSGEAATGRADGSEAAA
jgi:hypothetical protein